MAAPSPPQPERPGGRPPGNLRELGVALGLANLLHVRHWSWFLNENNGYFRATPVPWQMGAITLGGVLVTCLAFLLARHAAATLLPRRLAREILMVGFIATTLLAANGVRHQVWNRGVGDSVATWLPVVGFLALGAVVVPAAVRWRAQAARSLATVMLWSLPFAGLTVGQTLWAMLRQLGVNQLFRDQPPALSQANAVGGRRVLLLVFDGLDQTVALEASVGPELPAFARLRREAIECTQAYPPSYSTAVSLPSLLVGHGIAETGRAGPNDLWLRLEGESRRVSWSREETLFGAVRREGLNVGVVGWYHPYCRIFGSELTYCRAHSYQPEPDYSPAGNARRYAACLVETVPGAIRHRYTARLGLLEPTPDEQREWHAAQCRAIEAEARQAALDRTLGLVFVHYPMPHFPYIYDGHGRKYDTSGASSYLDNLVLADDVLGRLRSAMQEAGMWESSTVILTADHWNRDQAIPLARSPFPVIGHQAHRVPVLIKMAGQASPAEFTGAFRTFHLHDLVLAVLRGELQAPAEVAAWLGRRTESSHGRGTGQHGP